MNKTLRGRPKLNLTLTEIINAVRKHRQVVAAARELGCSDSYIHVKLKEVGSSLADILADDGLQSLRRGPQA